MEIQKLRESREKCLPGINDPTNQFSEINPLKNNRD